MKNFPSPLTVDLVYGMSYHQEWLVQDTWGLFFSEETLTDDVNFLKTNDGSDDVDEGDFIQVMGGTSESQRRASIEEFWDHVIICKLVIYPIIYIIYLIYLPKI